MTYAAQAELVAEIGFDGVEASMEYVNHRDPALLKDCIAAIRHDHEVLTSWLKEYGLNSDSACDDSVWIEQDYLEIVH